MPPPDHCRVGRQDRLQIELIGVLHHPAPAIAFIAQVQQFGIAEEDNDVTAAVALGSNHRDGTARETPTGQPLRTYCKPLQRQFFEGAGRPAERAQRLEQRHHLVGDQTWRRGQGVTPTTPSKVAFQ